MVTRIVQDGLFAAERSLGVVHFANVEVAEFKPGFKVGTVLLQVGVQHANSRRRALGRLQDGYQTLHGQLRRGVEIVVECGGYRGKKRNRDRGREIGRERGRESGGESGERGKIDVLVIQSPQHHGHRY